MIFTRVINESLRMAVAQMLSNKLRTLLSLLGISIGIFCIITVLAAVDSLERNILNGFSELGSDVIYIDKQPWNEDPNENYWKYLKRPEPSLKDYETIRSKSKLVENVAYCYFSGAGTMKYENNSIQGGFAMGSTPEYVDLQGLKLEKGRFFSKLEYNSASNALILGYHMSDQLFGDLDPIGKEVKLLGRKFTVIGVLEKEGDSFFNFLDFDEVAWMPIKTMAKFYRVGQPYGNENGGMLLAAQVKDGYGLDELKDELTGILRSTRRLRPTADENFSLNQITMLQDAIQPVIDALNIAGFIIGIFSLIVGMISVANIMFVSVKERTGMIGIKKALGAKQYFVLLEFLLESIFLCVIGGAIGLLFVFGILQILSLVIPFQFWLSPFNVLIGISVSILVGILAGMIPAWSASKLDPVVAIRS